MNPKAPTFTEMAKEINGKALADLQDPKTGQEIIIDGGIRVTVTSIGDGRVKIGISAPPHIKVDRGEVAARMITIWRCWRWACPPPRTRFDVSCKSRRPTSAWN